MATRNMTKTTSTTTKSAAKAETGKTETVKSDAVTVTTSTTVEEKIEQPKTPAVKAQPRKFEQTDLILCRSVTAGWLGLYGKSGIEYIFSNYGDVCEVEYGDLFALKNKRSRYLYDPLIIIEDEELLENPRWKDLAEFYGEKVYGMDDINEVLSVPYNKFESLLRSLPKGLLKALTVEVATRIENGTFDSIKKIKVIDDVCGTDFWVLASGSDT